MDTNTAPIVVPGSANSSGPQQGPRAAANLLEMAARDAETWVAEARAEAEALVRAGHAEADRLTTSARSEAHQLLNDARVEAERIRAEMDQAKGVHTTEVARLHRLEDDARDQLRSHLTTILAQVNASRRDGVPTMPDSSARDHLPPEER